MKKKGQGRLLSAISRLRALDCAWPPGYQLFAANGSLLLVRNDTGKVVWAAHNIHCDGGDPGTVVDDTGTEYVIRPGWGSLHA